MYKVRDAPMTTSKNPGLSRYPISVLAAFSRTCDKPKGWSQPGRGWLGAGGWARVGGELKGVSAMPTVGTQKRPVAADPHVTYGRMD